MKRAVLVHSAVSLAASCAAVAVLALAGCSHMGMSDSGETYTATLVPGDEVPPAMDSQGRGTAEVHVDRATNELTYKVSWSGLTGPATMGHIHGPAAPGQNAKVVVPFQGVANATSTEGKAKITPAQYADLAAGMYYVNIHTAKHPGGEIRGQLTHK
jgi:hypothetical protein